MSAIESKNIPSTFSYFVNRILSVDRTMIIGAIALSILGIVLFTTCIEGCLKMGSVSALGGTVHAVKQHALYSIAIPLKIAVGLMSVITLGIAIQRQKMPSPLIKAPMEMRAAMSGKCSKLASLKVGDVVEEGAALYEIESMKMFMTSRALAKGKVTQIFVKEGDILQLGQRVMLIE